MYVRPLGWWSATVALLGATACTPGSLAGANQGTLSYGLVIDNGTSTLSGRVLSPESLLRPYVRMLKEGTSTLAEAAVPDAKVEVVDEQGAAKPGIPPVQSDEAGRFKIRGLRIGEASYLRAAFTDASGRSRYLYTYVRPGGEVGCSEISLPSTLIAGRIAQDPAKAPLYDPAKLLPITSEVRNSLTGALAAPCLPLPPKELIDAATSAKAPADVARSGGSLLDTVVRTTPSLDDELEKAVDTYLVVTFTLQGVMANSASFPGMQDMRHMMIGQANVTYALADDHYEGVTFWLNNDMAAEATLTDGQWRARVDTRQKADGPYVLVACARSKDDHKQRVLSRAFIYVKNSRPDEIAANDCWAEAPSEGPSPAPATAPSAAPACP